MPHLTRTWMNALKAGDDDAMRNLWEELFPKLCRFVAPRAKSLRLVDTEDIALDAFADFCESLKRNQFDDLQTLEEVWRLLATIASRRTLDCHRYERRQRRGGNVKIYSFEELRDTSSARMSYSPEYSFSNIMLDILRSVDDEQLVNVLQWKMDGRTDLEVAERLGCGLRKVQQLLAELERRIRGARDVNRLKRRSLKSEKIVAAGG